MLEDQDSANFWVNIVFALHVHRVEGCGAAFQCAGPCVRGGGVVEVEMEGVE